eukprot:gene1078-4896_t
MKTAAAIWILGIAFKACSAKDNTLAITPPMGWSSWNAYGGHQSADELKQTADLLEAKGLKELGYVHVDMDGGWKDFRKPNNASGYPTTSWDMKGLANYLHIKGFKMGMYLTGGFNDVYGYEEQWAEVMFNEWGADSVKVDHMCSVADGAAPGKVEGCQTAPGAINHASDQIVPAFQQATMERWAAAIEKINKTNDVLFNNCGIGCSPSEGLDSRDPRPWGEWCRETANTWRSSGDINVQSWHTNLESLIGRGSYSLPGGWNYPDSLEVGNGKRGKIMPESEARAHFSLWCITSSPLYLGTKLQNLSESDLAIVSNKDAINVNQAWAGFAGDMLNYSSPNVLPSNISKSNYSRLPENSVWWKPLPNASAAAVMYASRGPAEISFRFNELIWNGKAALPAGTSCKVKNVWENRTESGPVSGGYSAHVAANDVVFVILHDCV